MKPPTALDTLQELARTRADAAAAAFGEALQASRTSADRLALLERYRDEYRTRLAAAVGGGVSMVALANYRAFLDRLDTAIAHAAADEAHRRAMAEAGAARWRVERSREKSLEVLADRREAEARLDETRRAQKQTDEIAARIAAARAGS